MPHRLAVAELSDRFAIFDDVREEVQFGILLVERLAVGIRSGRIEFSEIPAEGDELEVRELLAVENDDKPLAPYDRLDVAWRHGPRKIDPGDFSAQRDVQILD